MIDAHFNRWINIAYREMARQYIIPRLHSGNPVALTIVPGSTQRYFLPYDFSRAIAFFDSNNRSLDVIPNEDVRQFGEYNSFGSFVQYYEYHGVNQTVLADSGATPITIGVANRDTTVTASGAVFTSAMVGEYLLPLARNTATGLGNPEDYAYKIASFTSTTVVVLATPFRGVLADAGTVSDLVTSYFQVRPIGTPIIRIWGDPGASTTPTINLEYQKVPAKLANDEDSPEEDRLSEALVYKAIDLAGWAYLNAFMVKKAQEVIANSLGAFQTVKDFDRKLIHNFLQSNPMARSYSMLAGQRMGMGWDYSFGSVKY